MNRKAVIAELVKLSDCTIADSMNYGIFAIDKLVMKNSSSTGAPTSPACVSPACVDAVVSDSSTKVVFAGTSTCDNSWNSDAGTPIGICLLD